MFTNRKLHARWVVTCILFMSAAALLAWLVITSGPSISTVRFIKNSKGEISTASQLLRVEMNRPILNKDINVTFEPNIKVNTLVVGRQISIKPMTQLLTNSTYKVTITGDDAGRAWQNNFTFTTEQAEVLYLERNAIFDNKDIIYSQVIGKEKQVIAQDEKISFFTQYGNTVWYVSKSDNIHTLVEVKKNKKRFIPIPASKITSLDAGTYGLAITTQLDPKSSSTEAQEASNDTVWFYPYSTRSFTALPGITNNEPLKATALQFAPDSQLIITISPNGSSYLSDPVSRQEPTLLGEYSNLPVLKYDGSELLFQKQDGWYSYKPKEKLVTPLPDRLAYQQDISYIDDTNYIGRAFYDPFTGELSNRIAIYNLEGEIIREITDEDTKQYYTSNLTVSPNQELITVEVSASDSIYDNYRYNSKPITTITKIYDSKGKKITSAKGHSLRWAR